jgi:hypothetical protein
MKSIPRSSAHWMALVMLIEDFLFRKEKAVVNKR